MKQHQQLVTIDEIMTMQRHRAPSMTRRYRPEFVNNDAQLQAVLLHAALKYSFRFKIMPPDFVADLQSVVRLAKERHDFEKERVGASQRLLQQRIYHHLVVVEQVGGYVAFIGAVAYRTWRLEWPADEVAAELGVAKFVVNKTVRRLVQFAEELGLPTYRHQVTKPFTVDAEAIRDFWHRTRNVEVTADLLGYDTFTVSKTLDRLKVRTIQTPTTDHAAIAATWGAKNSLTHVQHTLGYSRNAIRRSLALQGLRSEVRRG